MALLVPAAALLAVPGAHAADDEMCQGKPATIVQADGGIKGTDGPDVDGRDYCEGLRRHGQGGNDVLIGSYDDDVLIGGPGRDRAIGGPADAEADWGDACRAEVRVRCELRRPPY